MARCPQSGVNWLVFNPAGSTAAIDATMGNPASSIGIVDTSTNAARASLNFGVPAFSPFNMNTPGQEVFKISFDLRVDAFVNSSPGNGSTPRVGLKDGTTDRNFILGSARNHLADGDGDQDVLFYAGDSGTGTAYLLDNMVVEGSAVPEPISLIPATLGSLTLLRRRRHP